MRDFDCDDDQQLVGRRRSNPNGSVKSKQSSFETPNKKIRSASKHKINADAGSEPKEQDTEMLNSADEFDEMASSGSDDFESDENNRRVAKQSFKKVSKTF